MLKLALITAVGLTAAWPALADPQGDCQQRRDLDRRIKGCSLIIAAKADNRPEFLALAYVARSDAYTDKGQYEQAISDATKAIEIRGTPLAYNQRAWSLFKAGKAEQALMDANKAVEAVPNNADYLDTRGHIFEVLGKSTEAIADYKQALKLEPDNPELQVDKEAIRRLGGTP